MKYFYLDTFYLIFGQDLDMNCELNSPLFLHDRDTLSHFNRVLDEVVKSYLWSDKNEDTGKMKNNLHPILPMS